MALPTTAPARVGPPRPAPRLARQPGNADGPAVALGIGSWVALVLVAIWWGQARIVGRGLGVNAAPLVGHWIWHPSWALAAPIAVALSVVVWGPRVSARAPWRSVPILAGAATTLWTVTLAASDGWDQVTRPLTTRHEYEPFAARIDGLGGFLRNFVERLPDTPIHVQGHPPGAPLVPWALDAVGLRGAGWFAALVLVAWGTTIAATLVAARRVAGEDAARRVAPALVLLPAAVWAGTSADAVFAGVLGVGVAVVLSGGTGARSRGWALAGGAVLGTGLLLTYGGVAMLAIPALVLLRQRRVADAALMGVGAGLLLVGVAMLSGFWWLDGLHATHDRYLAGVASQRPTAYFALVGNPGALAFAVGPAVFVGFVIALRRWRDAAALLPLAALAALVVVDASSLSKGEVERIWLPFVPWLALAAPGHRRSWLAIQAALALLLQAWLVGKW